MSRNRERGVRAARAAAAVASPCTGVCRIDDADRRCVGCGRTLGEIAAWPDLDDAARGAMLRRLAARREAKAAPPPPKE